MKPGDRLKLRVLEGRGQLTIWHPPAEVCELALPLARELRMMADVVGPQSREVAEELIALLESPRRPRRAA